MIKVSDLAYCRLRVPDLATSDRFLLDFGLLAAGSEPHRRFYRASDPSPYCYILEEGPEQFLGFAFHARSRADLDIISASMNLPIEPIDAPGGGERVRLTEPNGYAVDVVFGIAAAEPIDVKRPLNNSGARPLARPGELFRVQNKKPTPLKRLAHVAIQTPLVEETIKWFADTLGLITSDEMVAGPEETLFGSFLRLDGGESFVDHHSIFINKSGSGGVCLGHISFESQDIDAVLSDHYYLKGLERYDHAWGIGRHLLGSQLFDYWLDPYGYSHEHWSDTDRLNADAPPNRWDVRDGMANQWGETPSERMLTRTRKR